VIVQQFWFMCQNRE